ncbi:MAG: HAD hydrolase family protein [Rhodothermales bacterium]
MTVKLFVADIDGCLSEPYAPFDLTGLATLRQMIQVAQAGHPTLPLFTLCSGRPFPYVEAMGQALGIQQPMLFEAGAGCFDPVANTITWHPRLTDAMIEQSRAVTAWAERDLIQRYPLALDHAKRTQVSLVARTPELITELLPEVEEVVAREAPDLTVFQTSHSIDIHSPELTKAEGLRWLGQQSGIDLAHMAYIGDSEGDRLALLAVGHAFAPANASAALQHDAIQWSSETFVAATTEAYRTCVLQNASRAGGSSAT